MSDRTQFAIGRNSISMPRITKRLIEAVVATGLTALLALIILVLNNVLTGSGGWLNGFEVWLAFIRQPDILGTMLMTSVVAVFYIAWQRETTGKR